MSETKTNEQVVEAAEAAENAVEVNVEPEEKESASSTRETPIDYLDESLFSNIKTINKDELQVAVEQPEVPEEILEKYFSTFSDIQENQVITGRVIGINDNDILVDIGFKSEGIINREEFSYEDLPEIGEQLEVFLERIEDRQGNTILSKSKADFMRRWQELKEAFENETVLKGKIIKRIKGGMVVDMGVVQAFLPGSQVDVRPIQDFDRFLEEEMEFKIVKFNEARKNIVVSRKAILEESLKEQREALFKQIKVGEILEGRVKNITDFGVFIDLGGLDGLLHITDLSWGRVNHPSDIVSMDDTITVKVIDYDEERKRVSLGLKQLSVHPWENMEDKYPIGAVVKGRIVSMTNYGAFIEIEPGVEGLIHVSEMSWTRHVKNPSEMFSMGDEIEAKVLAIDTEERKISLGFKQLQPDPWDKIEEKYLVGSIYHGKVINLTQFGAFVELEEGVDGLVHVSDLSWTKVVRHPKEIVEKSQEVDVRVLEVSRESRRVSLGLKQVQDDPWPEIVKFFETGKEVSGEIIRVLDKGIILQLEKDVEGIIPFSKSSKKERKNLSRQFKAGELAKGVVMEVKPEDKKVVLFSEELATAVKPSRPKDDVQEYLSNQEAPATQKIEIPLGDKKENEGEA